MQFHEIVAKFSSSIVKNHSELKLFVSRWSYTCHTFVAVCGEFTPNLEKIDSDNDVAEVHGDQPRGGGFEERK